jgi:hypothetical protein
MSIFQDKKILIHISLEVVVIGTMVYFFYTKSRQLEERMKLLEEQLVKTSQLLHEDMNMLKKKIKTLEQKSPKIEPMFDFVTLNVPRQPVKQSSPKVTVIEEVEEVEQVEQVEEVEEVEEVDLDKELDKELEKELNELDII